TRVSPPPRTIERKPVPKVAPEEHVDLLNALDDSVGLVGRGTLNESKEVQALKRVAPERPTQQAKKLASKGPTSLDVEIRLPRLEEFQQKMKEKEQAEAIRSFDIVKYQAEIRQKVEGVDACYAKHAKGTEAGTISVWFTLRLDGTVRTSGIEKSE